jgi:hypothetical protein
MRDPDLLKLQTQLDDSAQQQMQVTPGVDHGRLFRHVVPDQRRILLERRHRNGLVLKHEVDFIFRKRGTLQTLSAYIVETPALFALTRLPVCPLKLYRAISATKPNKKTSLSMAWPI